MSTEVFTKQQFAAKMRISEERLEQIETADLFAPAGLTVNKEPFYDEQSLEELPKMLALLELGYTLEEARKIQRKIGLPESRKRPKTQKGKFLTVGEVAERAGVSARTIKFWEEKGVLEVELRSQGGFRLYPEAFVTICKLIRGLQDFGFKLDEVKNVADLFKMYMRLERDPESMEPEQRLQIIPQLTAKLDEIEERTRALKESIREWERRSATARKSLGAIETQAKREIKRNKLEAKKAKAAKAAAKGGEAQKPATEKA